jgi:hypothetical protein
MVAFGSFSQVYQISMSPTDKDQLMTLQNTARKCFNCRHFCIKPRTLNDDGEDISAFFRSVTTMLDDSNDDSLSKADVASLRTSLDIWRNSHEIDSAEVAPMPSVLPRRIEKFLGRGDEGDCIVIEGECRRNPPQVGDEEMRWPSVNAVEWCSMHDAKGR